MKNLFAVKNHNRIFLKLTRAESSSELFWLPVVHLSVHLSVSKLYTFSSSPPEPLGQIQLVSLGEGDSSCSNKGPHPYPKGYDNTIPVVIKHWGNLKIFFSRITEPISTKLGTKHPWVKRNQVCSNEGPCPFPKGDNNEIVKMFEEI